jgi:hypothetical protein
LLRALLYLAVASGLYLLPDVCSRNYAVTRAVRNVPGHVSSSATSRRSFSGRSVASPPIPFACVGKNSRRLWLRVAHNPGGARERCATRACATTRDAVMASFAYICQRARKDAQVRAVWVGLRRWPWRWPTAGETSLGGETRGLEKLKRCTEYLLRAWVDI